MVLVSGARIRYRLSEQCRRHIGNTVALDLTALLHPARIATEYQIHDFDVFSIGFE
jgi:hypothetical protein